MEINPPRGINCDQRPAVITEQPRGNSHAYGDRNGLTRRSRDEPGDQVKNIRPPCHMESVPENPRGTKVKVSTGEPMSEVYSGVGRSHVKSQGSSQYGSGHRS